MASEHFPGLNWTAIEAHQNAEEVKKQIHAWLLTEGLSEEHAAYMVKDFLPSAMRTMLGLEPD